jgi:hypothetical protein
MMSHSIHSNQRIELGTLSNNSEFQCQCYIVYQEWVKKENDIPIHYIINSINKYVSGRLQLSELAKIDFQNGNFFSIEGLILSKTEAAFLALLGSNVK